MAENRYDTVAFDPQGKKHGAYIQDGKTFLQDGSRLQEGWSSQTRGGIYKMGADAGYGAETHNRPSQKSYLDTFREISSEVAPNHSWQPEKNYQQLGQDRYKPIFEAQQNALQNRLDSGVRDLEGNIAGVNTEYDRAVQKQQEMNQMAKQNYNAETLGRGMGRSTVATTGLASMDARNERVTGDINMDRANTINSIHGKIQSLKEGIGREIGTLEGNRGILEAQYADQLEDRDYGKWLDQAKLNQGRDNLMLEAGLNASMADYTRDMDEYDYIMGLEKERRLGDQSTLEGRNYQSAQQRAIDEMLRKAGAEYDFNQQNLLNRYVEGTREHDINKSMRDWDRDNATWQRDNIDAYMMKLQNSLAPSYGGGGGGGYSRSGGYSKGGYGGGSGGSSTLGDNMGSQMYETFSDIASSGSASAQDKYREIDKQYERAINHPSYIKNTTPAQRKRDEENWKKARQKEIDKHNKQNKAKTPTKKRDSKSAGKYTGKGGGLFTY